MKSGYIPLTSGRNGLLKALCDGVSAIVDIVPIMSNNDHNDPFWQKAHPQGAESLGFGMP